MDNEIKLGWLDVYGNLYDCKFGDHFSFAIDLCRSFGYYCYLINNYILNQDDPETVLFKHRFIKIGLDMDDKLCVYYNEMYKPTVLQQSYIDNLIDDGVIESKRIYEIYL